MRPLHGMCLALVTTITTVTLLMGCDRKAAAPPPGATAPPPTNAALPPPAANRASPQFVPPGAGSADQSATGGGAGAHGGAVAKTPPLRQTIEAEPGGKLKKIVWDFQEGRAPTLVKWPQNKGDNNVFSIEGNFDFELKVQDKKDFNGAVRAVESRKKEGEIEAVEITAPSEATDVAYARAKKMLAKLGFDATESAQLDAWHKKAQADNYDNLEIKHTNSYSRVYTVRIVNDGTSEQPWSVGLDIDWSQVCQCHG